MSCTRLIVFGSRVKPNRFYQIIKVINSGDGSRKEEIVSHVMKGTELFQEYGTIMAQRGHEVQRRAIPAKETETTV